MTSTTRRLTVAGALLGVAAAALVGTATSGAAAPGEHGNDHLDAVRAATAKYQDVDVALAHGYVADPVCAQLPGVGAMGIHYTHPRLASDLKVNAAQPEVLLYVPTEDGLQLVAVEYFAADAGQARPRVLGQSFDGPMPGHAPGMPTHYDLHVWLWEHNPAGTFSAWNPALSCDGGAQ